MNKLLGLMLMMFSLSVMAGTPVDMDGDGLYCVLEDDGVHCGEDGQDLCDGIPNVSREDDHCSMDKNSDGKFDISDVFIIQFNQDHLLTGIPYPDHELKGVPVDFGGFVCFDMMRVVEYNQRLTAVGLKPLQLDEPFIVTGPGAHCGGHHSYPVIK